MSTITIDTQEWPREGTPFANVKDARGLADLMLTKAQEQFQQKQAQATIALLVTKDQVQLLHIPLSSKENERIAGGNLVQKLAYDKDAIGVGLASEGWFLPGETEEGINDTKRLLERKDKVEVLVIQASWQGEDTAAKAREIVREGRKTPQLVERPDLFTPNGANGILLLKKQDEGSIGKQMLRRPIMV